MVNIKKVFVVFILTLIIVLGSVSSVFAETVYILNPDNAPKHIFWNTPNSDYTIYKADGTVLVNVSGTVKSAVGFSTWEGDPYFVQYNLNDTSGASYWQFGFPVCISNTGFIPLGERNNDAIVISGGAIMEQPDIQILSITPAQRILFNYIPSRKDTFLQSISCTEKKSITLTMGYMTGKTMNDITIKRDTTDLLFGPHAITLTDFPSPRVLSSGEYLSFSAANGGNIPIGGHTASTDTGAKTFFTVDLRQCTYKIVSANTGLTIASGGVTDGAIEGDIYNNNDNPFGGDLNDDYLFDRADYADGILGSIEFGFDTIFRFLKMPFELLYKFIMTLGEIVTYAVGAIGGLMGALTGLYGVLPTTISYLFTFAISITVFKLIFGR